MPNKLPYSKLVEKHILKCMRSGVAIKDMHSSMQHLQNAPRSLTTLYSTYGQVIHGEKVEVISAVGARIIDQAINGDPKDASTYKSQELVMRSKGGWSPTQTNIEVEQTVDPDLDESATSTLMSLLGYNNDDPEEEATTCACGEEDNCRCPEGIAAEQG